MEPWTILTRRYGGDVRDPSPADLAAAIHELYHEDLAGMTSADYEEHGSATLRYGFDEGPMFLVTVTRAAKVISSSGPIRTLRSSSRPLGRCLPSRSGQPSTSGAH